MTNYKKTYYIYILTNSRNTVLYIGVTNDISRRYFEHYKKMSPKSFAAKYGCDILVYIEEYSQIEDALQREKYLKGLKRCRKDELIQTQNPKLNNLFFSK